MAADLEITLDNFENIYWHFVYHQKINGEYLMNLPCDFIIAIKTDNYRYRGQKLWTRIIRLKLNIRQIEEICNKIYKRIFNNGFRIDSTKT